MEAMENSVDMFLCTHVDLFPRTYKASDIKMNVSSHVETVVLLVKKYINEEILKGEE